METNSTVISISSKVDNLKVGQFPDLHIGTKISDFNKINPLTGNYLQWDDQIDALNKATELMLEINPAVVIFPGDIYDRPSNIPEKLLAAFQECLLKLVKKDIAIVLFTGNHDFPKSREYKALISRYDGIGEYLNIVPVYKAQYEKININNQILIHCIPQCFNKEQFKDELASITRDDSFSINVLTTHIGIQGAGLSEYEHNEAWLNKLELDLDFDYIALGDYHRPIKVSEKCAYAGVLCKGNFADRDTKHGVLVFDGDTKEVLFSEYEVRGMEQYNIDCSELTSTDIDLKLEDIHTEFSRDKYIKIELNNISKLKQRQLDFKHIHSIKKEAFYCKISYVYLEEDKPLKETVQKSYSHSALKPLHIEFKNQLSTIVDNEDKAQSLYTLYEKNIKKENVN